MPSHFLVQETESNQVGFSFERTQIESFAVRFRSKGCIRFNNQTISKRLAEQTRECRNLCSRCREVLSNFTRRMPFGPSTVAILQRSSPLNPCFWSICLILSTDVGAKNRKCVNCQHRSLKLDISVSYRIISHSSSP